MPSRVAGSKLRTFQKPVRVAASRRAWPEDLNKLHGHRRCRWRRRRARQRHRPLREAPVELGGIIRLGETGCRGGAFVSDRIVHLLADADERILLVGSRARDRVEGHENDRALQ